MLALLKDQQNPGCFIRELFDLFDQNDLPKLNVDGFIPPEVESQSLYAQFSLSDILSINQLIEYTMRGFVKLRL